MIRNASDHGIERPEERIAAGKPRRGKIRLSATQEGGYIKLHISDDGRGLDIDRIRQKASTLGLASDADIERMTDNQAAKFIFHPGFSTANAITSISGRGVGMDVVRANIEQAGGSVDLRSEYGAGTTFIIRIPLTLAIAAALIVTCADQRFAIPQIAVVEVVKPRAGSDARIEKLNDSCVLRLREKLLPVASLKTLLKLSDETETSDFDNKFIVICQFENNLYGLAVDAVLQTEEIVIKPVSMRLRNIPVYSGTTILGDGSVIMIVDPNGVGGIIGTLSEGDIRHSALGNRLLGDAPEAKTSLLVFRAGSDSYKAVPLGLVTRLEEVPVEKIEQAASGFMLQYRGRLMPLVAANNEVVLRESGVQPILVFSRGTRATGMIVDEIVDIVQDRLEIEQASHKSGCIGSAIVRGRATDIVDVAAILPFIGAIEQSQQLQGGKGPRTILLADDSDFFRALLAPILKAAGFRVHVAETGEEALKFLLNHRCDALVTDLDMPGISGFEIASRLRADPAYAALRIVGLSERGGAATVSRGRQIGFDDIVGKFDRQGLVASLLDLVASVEKAA